MLLMLSKPRPTASERAWTSLSQIVTSALTVADDVVMWPFRRLENRRTLDALAAMSDHDLQDIGVTRSDLRDSLALPTTCDVGAFLADRRAIRRHYG
jgi:uncharacterized protein YjiS (DUF1127 family)